MIAIAHKGVKILLSNRKKGQHLISILMEQPMIALEEVLSTRKLSILTNPNSNQIQTIFSTLEVDLLKSKLIKLSLKGYHKQINSQLISTLTSGLLKTKLQQDLISTLGTLQQPKIQISLNNQNLMPLVILSSKILRRKV